MTNRILSSSRKMIFSYFRQIDTNCIKENVVYLVFNNTLATLFCKVAKTVKTFVLPFSFFIKKIYVYTYFNSSVQGEINGVNDKKANQQHLYKIYILSLNKKKPPSSNTYHTAASLYINFGYLFTYPQYSFKMHLLVLLLLTVCCWADIKVAVDEKGRYNISVNGNVWLRSSRTALYVNNKWYSSDDNSLPLTSITYGQGTDPNLGSWNETQLNFDLNASGTRTKVVGRIRQWSQVSAVTFQLDTGDQLLTNTQTLDTREVRTAFPSFHVEQIAAREQRGYFTFEGKMII